MQRINMNVVLTKIMDSHLCGKKKTFLSLNNIIILSKMCCFHFQSAVLLLKVAILFERYRIILFPLT